MTEIYNTRIVKTAQMATTRFHTATVWWGYTWATCVVIPFAILAFNMLIFGRVIPDWFISNYVVLTYASPNPVSMFLSNFAHANWAHLSENLISYTLTTGAIVFLALVVLPQNNKNPKGIKYTINSVVITQSTLVFFLALPFVLSCISTVTGNMFGITGGLGFSGIVYAFEGYLVYIIEVLLYRKLQEVKTRSNRTIMTVVGVCLMVSLPLAFILGQIMTKTSDPLMHANYIAHTVGFVIGMIVPFLLMQNR